jgi:hypothetical protein
MDGAIVINLAQPKINEQKEDKSLVGIALQISLPTDSVFRHISGAEREILTLRASSQ